MQAQPYEVRPMSLAEILDTGFRVVRDHPGALIGVQLLLALPVAIVQVWAGPSEGAARSEHWQAWLLVVLLQFAVAPIASAASTWVIGEAYVGRRVALGDAVQRALRMTVPIGVTMLVVGLAAVGGFILLVLPGVYVMIRLLLVWPVVVMERVYGTAALKRAWALTRGQFGRALAVSIVGFLIGMVLGLAGSGVAAVSFAGVQPAVNAVGGATAGAYVAALQVVFYYDVRCRTEAFDIEHLARLVESSEAAGTPALRQA
jgi:hypothetical protein